MRYGLWALYYLELYTSIANSKIKKGILKTDSLGGFISALENRRKMAQNDVELEMVAPWNGSDQARSKDYGWCTTIGF